MTVSIILALKFTVYDSLVVVVWCVIRSGLRVLLNVGVDDIGFRLRELLDVGVDGRIERIGCRLSCRFSSLLLSSTISQLLRDPLRMKAVFQKKLGLQSLSYMFEALARDVPVTLYVTQRAKFGLKNYSPSAIRRRKPHNLNYVLSIIALNIN